MVSVTTSGEIPGFPHLFVFFDALFEHFFEVAPLLGAQIRAGNEAELQILF